MSKKKEFIIEKITDVFELNDKQFDVFLKDFAQWRSFTKPLVESGLVKVNNMTWLDDGSPGCRGVNLVFQTKQEP